MNSAPASETAPPALQAPANACDCAIHVYEPGASLAPTATSSPPEWADADAYAKVQRRLGTTRVIIVQPTAYGLDNRVTLESVERFGRANARAIVMIDESITAADLSALHEKGACGVRFQMLAGGVLDWSAMEPVAARIAPLGWHIQLQMDGRELGERAALLNRLPCPLVIDHVGKFLEPVTPSHPGFRALAGLLENGRTWLKLSGAYEVSRSGPPDFADVGLLAKAAIAVAPERMLWGSNWPHVSKLADPPDDAGQLDLLLHWVDNEALRHRILIENPARLYGFS
jgi:D-galactarolactone isomerase